MKTYLFLTSEKKDSLIFLSLFILLRIFKIGGITHVMVRSVLCYIM